VKTIPKGTKRTQILLTDYQLVSAIYVSHFKKSKRLTYCSRKNWFLMWLN